MWTRVLQEDGIGVTFVDPVVHTVVRLEKQKDKTKILPFLWNYSILRIVICSFGDTRESYYFYDISTKIV